MMKWLLAFGLTGFLSVITVLAISWHARIGPGAAGPAHGAEATARAFEVPYRLTETNHFLVRVRINGKGPFNFLVDSGAPALYVATATATKAGLKPTNGEFWTRVDRLDLEGGASLTRVRARVEDPFQLVGMNALGLPGATIDGILGFTILARFRLQIDPTRDFMTWTLLDYIPPDPPSPRSGNGEVRQIPREVQALSVLGPLAKGLAFLVGKQPEEKYLLRGFLGLQWHEAPKTATDHYVEIGAVLKGSPADRAGLRPGDRLLSIGGHPIDSLKSAHAAVAKVQAGDLVRLSVERNAETETQVRQLTVTVTAEEGL